ncbi:MAG: hypothetical protein JWP44_4091 [Mucilaginibacter sp.]|nr:hypothetical protein [Mucilaginibacter sp.]
MSGPQSSVLIWVCSLLKADPDLGRRLIIGSAIYSRDLVVKIMSGNIEDATTNGNTTQIPGLGSQSRIRRPYFRESDPSLPGPDVLSVV